jgi:hypothetical protein
LKTENWRLDDDGVLQKLVRSGFSGAQMRLPEAGLSIKPLGVKRLRLGKELRELELPLRPGLILVSYW